MPSFARPELLNRAEDGSMFFHNCNNHWMLTHFTEGIVQLFDSLKPNYIAGALRTQMIALYGAGRLVRIPCVQMQKGYKDCGCFVLAFCISVVYGKKPRIKPDLQAGRNDLQLLQRTVANTFSREKEQVKETTTTSGTDSRVGYFVHSQCRKNLVHDTLNLSQEMDNVASYP